MNLVILLEKLFLGMVRVDCVTISVQTVGVVFSSSGYSACSFFVTKFTLLQTTIILLFSFCPTLRKVFVHSLANKYARIFP